MIKHKLQIETIFRISIDAWWGCPSNTSWALFVFLDSSGWQT
jgi:hypothetical protein